MLSRRGEDEPHRSYSHGDADRFLDGRRDAFAPPVDKVALKGEVDRGGRQRCN
ncbi:hypothetical protein FRC12_007599 [Ceratobasidium sp. 428]|nr:hypothetical protein FRC12_007599 [Ceratobasidium sp. 428]